MNPSPLLVDRPAPHIVRFTLNRPDKRNAIDHAMRSALLDAAAQARADADIHAVVLAGAGGFFSAGGDVASMAGLTAEQALVRMQHVHQVCRAIAELPLPVVAAVEGMAVGAGAGLALLADAIVSGPSSKFAFPFLQLGLVPDWGLLASLPRRIGAGAARRLIIGQRRIDGSEAQRLGLVDELAEDAEVMDAAIRHACAMAALPRAAFAQLKKRLAPSSPTLEEALSADEADQTRLLTSDDFREGLAAMLEKRVPRFTR